MKPRATQTPQRIEIEKYLGKKVIIWGNRDSVVFDTMGTVIGGESPNFLRVRLDRHRPEFDRFEDNSVRGGFGGIF